MVDIDPSQNVVFELAISEDANFVSKEVLQETYNAVTESLGKIPDAFTTSIQPLVGVTGAVIKSVPEFKCAAGLKTLLECLTTTRYLKEAEGILLLDGLSGFKFIREYRPALLTAVQSENVAGRSLQQYLTACGTTVARTAIAWSVAFTLLSITVEVVSLSMLFYQLRQIQKTKDKREAIEVELKQLVETVNKFATDIKAEYSEDMCEDRAFATYLNTQRERDEIIIQIQKILTEIVTLEQGIEKDTSSLKTFCKFSPVAISLDGIGCVSLAVTTGIFGAAAGPALLGVAIGGIVATLGIAVTHSAFWIKAKCNVESLEKELQVLATLKEKVEAQKDKLEDVFKEFINILKEKHFNVSDEGQETREEEAPLLQ